MKRLAIVGSRDYADLDQVRQFVRRRKPDTVIVSGGARGVDRVAVETATKLGRQTEVFLAQWETFGRSAGCIRNEKMISTVDGVVAFWDGKSRGTKHAIEFAKKLGKPVWIF